MMMPLLESRAVVVALVGFTAGVLVGVYAVNQANETRRKREQSSDKGNDGQPSTCADGNCGGKSKCQVCELSEPDAELPAHPFMGSVFVFGRDLSNHTHQFEALSKKGYLKYFSFFGCDLGKEEPVVHKEATVLSRFRTPLPFEPFRDKLYTIDELYAGFNPDRPAETYAITADALIYKDFVMSSTRPRDFNEALARRLHDACITEVSLLHRPLYFRMLES